MLMKERLLASKIAVRLREKYPKIYVEVNLYTGDKLVIRFKTNSDDVRLITVTLSDLNTYADEEDMIEDAIILVKRNIKEN